LTDFQGEEILMQQSHQQVQHHQVVEEILPDQMSDEVTKEVINQFLPQRKRKPRTPKGPGNKQNPSKIIKLEPTITGSEQTITTVTATQISNVAETSEHMVVEETEQVSEMVEQIVGDDGGIEEQIEQSSTPAVKAEGTPKTPKDKSNSKLTLRSHY